MLSVVKTKDEGPLLDKMTISEILSGLNDMTERLDILRTKFINGDYTTLNSYLNGV